MPRSCRPPASNSMCLIILLFDVRRSKNNTPKLDETTPLLSSTDSTTASSSATIVATPPARTQHMTPSASNMSHPRPGSPLRPHLGHRWVSKHLRHFQHPFMPPATTCHATAAAPQDEGSEAQHTSYVDEAPFQTPALPLHQPSTRRRRDDEVSVSTAQSDTHEIDIVPFISIDIDLATSLDTITDLPLHRSPESDGSIDEITIDEASMVSSTGWAESTDRLLCYLWFFTGYSFATMGAVLNFAREEEEAEEWLDGEKARKRLLQLMDGVDEHGFVWHEVLKLSGEDQSKDSVVEVERVEKQLQAAWQAMRSDLIRTADPDDGRYTPALKKHILELKWTGLMDQAKRTVTRAEIERLIVDAEAVARKAVNADVVRSRISAFFGSGHR